MNITFLGTGSNTPTPKKEGKPFRSYSSILVDIGKETLLFDIGPGTLTKLQQSGISTGSVPTTLFLTHYHVDHCLDYVGIIKERALRFLQGENISKLTVYGPLGLLKWHEQLWMNESWSYMVKELHVSQLVDLHEIDESNIVQQNNWKVDSLSVPHENGLAYKLDTQGKSFVYSGDMGYIQTFADFSQNADMVTIECSFPDKKSVKGTHLCPEDVGRLAKAGNWRQAVLTHLYPCCEGKEHMMIDTVITIAKTVKVIVAYDLLKLLV